MISVWQANCSHDLLVCRNVYFKGRLAVFGCLASNVMLQF